MAIIKIIPGAGFTKQLEDGCVRFGSIALNNRVALNFKQIASEVGNFLATVAGQSDVMKSLRGGGSVDLPAHFGLSDGDANGLVEGMLNIIRGSVVVGFTTQGSNGRGTINIKAVQADFQEFLALPGASYISKPSNITIPVVEWMLLNPTVDSSTAAYAIVFSGDNMFNSKSSRSGRAIMVTLKRLGGGTSYVLPDIISKGSLGNNFIEFALSQEGVARKCAEIVIAKIK